MNKFKKYWIGAYESFLVGFRAGREKAKRNFEAKFTARKTAMDKWIKERKVSIIIILSALALLLIVLLLIVPALKGIKLFNNNQIAPTAAPMITSAPTTAPTLAPNPLFKQTPGDNSKNKVDAKFSSKFEKALDKTKKVDEAALLVLLKNSANNAKRLAIWANSMGLYSNPNDSQKLLTEKGDYLSQEGIKLFYKMKKALKAKTTDIKIINAPSTGFNTYIDSKGDFVISNNSGIKGNRKAIQITFKDGNGKVILKVTIMLRCGNPVHKTKIIIPPKPKPTPTPNATPQPTPKVTPRVTPNPTPQPTLAPKGTAGPYPTGKPTTKPVETTPHHNPVVTPAPSPKPIVAPDATPAPKPVKTPEPGVNPTKAPSPTTPPPGPKPTKPPLPNPF